MKKYIIFDMDGTIIESETVNFPLEYEHLKTYLPDLEYDYFKYFNIQTAGTPLREQIQILFKNTLSEEAVNKITDELYQIIVNNKDKHPFFDGVQDMVHSLQKDYTLYLSTGNSDEYAKKKLSDGWIAVCFDRIIWSTLIWKSSEHIKIFKDLSWDENFEKHAIFIGDGNTDRDIAQSCWIDFIKVWKSWIDTFEVDNTIEARAIIKKL